MIFARRENAEKGATAGDRHYILVRLVVDRSGIVGIVLGAVGGYFPGTMSGVFAGTIGGEALAICRTAEIASSQKIISAEDANRLLHRLCGVHR